MKNFVREQMSVEMSPHRFVYFSDFIRQYDLFCVVHGIQARAVLDLRL